jgi:hypothetical protein
LLLSVGVIFLVNNVGVPICNDGEAVLELAGDGALDDCWL